MVGVCVESIKRLKNVQNLESIKHRVRAGGLTNLDYRDVVIEKDSIVYCDIPYQMTDRYKIEIDYNDFHDWANRQTEPVFISEYDIKDDRFYQIFACDSRSTLSSSSNRTKTVEKLYINRAATVRYPYLLDLV